MPLFVFLRIFHLFHAYPALSVLSSAEESAESVYVYQGKAGEKHIVENDTKDTESKSDGNKCGCGFRWNEKEH